MLGSDPANAFAQGDMLVRGIARYGEQDEVPGDGTWSMPLAGFQAADQPEASVPGAALGGPGMFSPAGLLDEARYYHTATPLDDGRVLVVGGITEPWDIGATDRE